MLPRAGSRGGFPHSGAPCRGGLRRRGAAPGHGGEAVAGREEAMTEVNEVNLSRGGQMAEGEGGALRQLLKIIVIGIVLLLLIAAGAGAVWWFLTSDSTSMPGGGAAVSDGSQPLENPQYLDVGSFVVNLADGRRYLKTTIQLLMSEEGARAYLEQRMPQVKDLVVAELQTLNSEQLRDPKERELLKQRLLRKVESLLPTRDYPWDDPNPVKQVLITEFYLQ